MSISSVWIEPGQTWKAPAESCVRIPCSYFFFDWFVVPAGFTIDNPSEVRIELVVDDGSDG